MFPPVSPDNYNLTQATVTASVKNQFSRVFGLSLSNISTVAIAAHRPRDIAIVLDYSGSMNNESDLWNCEIVSGQLAKDVEQHRSGLSAVRPLRHDVFAAGHDAMHEHRSASRILQCDASRVGRSGDGQRLLSECPRLDGRRRLQRGPRHDHQHRQRRRSIFARPRTLDQSGPNWKDITGSSSTGFNGYAASQGGQDSTDISKGPDIGARRFSSGRPIRSTIGESFTSSCPSAAPA